MRKTLILLLVFFLSFSSLTVYATEASTVSEETLTVLVEENFTEESEVANENSYIANDENFNESELSAALSEAGKSSGWAIGIGILLMIILLVMLLKSNKKNKTKNNFRKELEGYIKASQKHTYSGNVSVSQNGIYYSRGNKSVLFEIPINKETILAPFMTDEWFLNKNYNYREVEMILSDISFYLTENRVCKSVKILSDEEYEELFKTSENDSEEYETEDCDTE